jgi:hypothetical protein
MPLDILLPEATNRLGGFSDACHSLTAATTVAVGKEEQLIDEMESILESEIRNATSGPEGPSQPTPRREGENKKSS